MPTKILPKDPLKEYSDDQRANIKKGIVRFNDLYKRFKYMYFYNLINNHFDGNEDITIIDEFVRNLNLIFNPDFSIFFLNSLINFSDDYVNFIKELKIKDEERFIETHRELSATFSTRIRKIISQMFGADDWKRIHSDIIIRDDYIGNRIQIVKYDGKQIRFNLNNNSISILILNLINAVFDSIQKFNQEILLQIYEKERLEKIIAITDDILKRYDTLSGEPNLITIDEELAEFLNEILLVEGNVKFMFYFNNYNEPISFGTSINSTFILIEHLLKRIPNTANKISEDLYLKLKIENIKIIKTKIKELSDSLLKIEEKYEETKSDSEE